MDTADRLGGRIFKLLVQFFAEFDLPKSLISVNFLTVIK